MATHGPASSAARFFRAFLQGPHRTRPASGSTESPTVTKHFNLWVLALWLGGMAVLPLEIVLAQHDDASPARARAVVVNRVWIAVGATLQLVVWRTSVPLISVRAHSIFMASYSLAGLVGCLFSNSIGAYVVIFLMGIVPLHLAQFVGHTAAVFSAVVSYLSVALAYSLRKAGYAVADYEPPVAETLLYYGPVVWAYYSIGYLQTQAVSRELLHSKAALSEALRALRRAVREREGLVRFLCHELRSPLNCIALGLDELATGRGSGSVGRSAYDAEIAAVVRNQIENIRACLDDLMLVVGPMGPPPGQGAAPMLALPALDSSRADPAGVQPRLANAAPGRQALNAPSLARLLHSVARLTEARRPRDRRGHRTHAKPSLGHIDALAAHIRTHAPVERPPDVPATSVAVTVSADIVGRAADDTANQISEIVQECRDVGAVVDTSRLINVLATVVLTSTARGAQSVTLAATVESGALFDPLTGPPSVPPGFVVPPPHADNEDSSAAQDFSGSGRRVGDREASRSSYRINSPSASGMRSGGADEGHHPAHWLVVTVTDDAPGRAEQDLANLFQPFESLRLGDLDDGVAAGSGLSFFVLQRMAVDMGGAAWVASRPAPNSGNLLDFALPLHAIPGLGATADAVRARPDLTIRVDDPAASTAAEMSARRLSGMSPADWSPSTPASRWNGSSQSESSSDDPQRRRVLIVDDVRSVRMLLRHATVSLFDGNVEVTEAADGAEAVRLALELQPACILMDRRMPVMDGDEATRRLRAAGYRRPVFGVTGDAMPTDVSAFVDAGATEVLVKPVTKARLARALRDSGVMIQGLSSNPEDAALAAALSASESAPAGPVADDARAPQPVSELQLPQPVDRQ
jgi:CheY-like chemotaxis protein/signal transduction histidine kinase